MTEIKDQSTIPGSYISCKQFHVEFTTSTACLLFDAIWLVLLSVEWAKVAVAVKPVP